VPKLLYADAKYYYPYLTKRFGACPPEFGYKDILKQFTAEKWNPDAWAELFDKAGAKYVVLTAEHHDGFALWDSDLTPWCATKVGPMRDLVGDLGVAVRKKGLRYAPSYHRERHPGFFAVDKYKVNSEPLKDISAEIERVPEAASLYGPFDYDDAFIADYVARWKEIQTKYQPDFMWIDDIPIFYKDKHSEQTQKFHDAFQGMIADYFNAAQKWEKDVYLNNKGKNLNWPEGLGCLSKDNLNIKVVGPKWENPATLRTSYGYMKEEELNDSYRSSEELIHLLIDVVSKNGNLLLNIGPRADGTIPEGMQKRLLGIGEWLDLNGEAIYGTRYWTVPNQKKGNLAFTCKGKTLYAIALSAPTQPFSIEASKEWEQGTVRSVRLIGSDASVDWAFDSDGLRITPPKDLGRGQSAWVFEVATRAELHRPRTDVSAQQALMGTKKVDLDGHSSGKKKRK
jgi:alpha-L-fucosidase